MPFPHGKGWDGWFQAARYGPRFQPTACSSPHKSPSPDLGASGGIVAVGAAARAAHHDFGALASPVADAAGFIAQAAAHRPWQRLYRWRGLWKHPHSLRSVRGSIAQRPAWVDDGIEGIDSKRQRRYSPAARLHRLPALRWWPAPALIDLPGIGYPCFSP